MLLTDFETAQGYNCILGNVSNSMKYYHIDISEPDIFFWNSPFYSDKYMRKVFERFYEERGESTWPEFAAKGLSEGKPVLVSIDQKVIPYVKHDMGDDSIRHYINIIGIDLEEHKIYVSDSYVPTQIPSTYEGWMDCGKLTDIEIENSWCIKRDVIRFLRQEVDKKEIRRFTRYSMVQRLKEFLRGTGQGTMPPYMEKLGNMQNAVCDQIARENHEEVFKLLAGMRLNVINPLIYLLQVLRRNGDEDAGLTGELNALIKEQWEKLNMRLVKFAVAHKKLDKDSVFESFHNAICGEEEVLGHVIERHDGEETVSVLEKYLSKEDEDLWVK